MKFNLWPFALSFIVPRLFKNVGGMAIMFVTLRLQKYENDVGLLAHELEHVRQFWRLTLIAGICALATLYLLELPLTYAWLAVPLYDVLYLLIPAYRLHCELVAYRLQATFYLDDRRPLFAEFIANDYWLTISPENALQRLKS